MYIKVQQIINQKEYFRLNYCSHASRDETQWKISYHYYSNQNDHGYVLEKLSNQQTNNISYALFIALN